MASTVSGDDLTFEQNRRMRWCHMKISRIFRITVAIGRLIRTCGPLRACRLVFEWLVRKYEANWFRAWQDARFDKRYRVETSGYRTLQQLGMHAERGRGSYNYRGTPVAVFDAAFDSLSIDWKRFEFVDYGSGMGKALLLAARYPFRRVTGVEFSAELQGIAERNIAQWLLPEQRCHSLRCVLADVATWPLPEGDCLLYFFNPFGLPLLRNVLRHIVFEAARKTNDAVYIVYILPAFPEVLREFLELRLVTSVRILAPLYEIYKIETSPGLSVAP